MPGPAVVPILTHVVPAGISALATLFGVKSSNKSADRAAQYQVQAARYAADLQAKANAEALAFAKQQEEARRREWEQMQARNYGIYQDETAREQGRYDSLQARMQPYRQFGRGSLSQLGRPIPGAGSLGARMGG